MTDRLWGGILQSRSTKEFAEKFRKKLTDKLVGEESAEALKLLHGIREELLKELSAGRRIPEEVGKLIEELSKIKVADELKSLMERFLLLVTELYNTRASVSSTFSLAQSFYDRLITTAFNHAVSLLETEGLKAPDVPYVLLVSGEMGRAESILGSRSRFFFIYSQSGKFNQEHIDKLAVRFMAVLALCFPSVSRNLNSPSLFWFGSDALWSETTRALLRIDRDDNWEKTGVKNFSLLLETVADMRILSGDQDFGESVLEAGRKILVDCIKGELFWHLAKDTASMPVALGIFGRFKTIRSGRNRGKFDLKGMAIDPLAAAVRLLSLPCGRSETTFTDRVKSILAAGNIGVSLADRLLIAYQDFMRERIRLELTGEKLSDGLFFNPDSLDEESRERFKTGLEDLTTLQRLVHQQLVEVVPR